MSESREKILGRVRAATSSLPSPASRPDYDPALPVSRNGQAALEAADPTAIFAQQWQAVHGRWAAGWPSLVDLLKSDSPGKGYCAPEFLDALEAVWPDAPVRCEFDRSRIDEYAFAITPAWGAIAETGTVVLVDKLSPARLADLAPWTHVAVIPEGRIFPTVAAALASLPEDPSIVMVTGPSKTADIEGILIEGVHGPGIQVAMIHAE